MANVEITILNPIWSKIEKGVEYVQSLLSYDASVWRNTGAGKRKSTFKKYLIKKNGMIYTGWITKIIAYCKDNKISCDVFETDTNLKITKEVVPLLNNQLPQIGNFKKLRTDQQRQVDAAIKHKRGVLIAPTGGGKTIEAFAIMKAFEPYNILFLVPGISLLAKTINQLNTFGFRDVGQLGAGQKNLSNRIIVATIQTMREMDLKKLVLQFDVVIVDEAHIAIEEQQTLETILSHLAAPVRIGLTATEPQKPEQKLVLEGLLGPVIDRSTFKEGFERGSIVKPTINMVVVPLIEDISGDYQWTYKKGIVENQTRNRLVVSETEYYLNERRAIIIFSSPMNVNHGHIIQDKLKSRKIDSVYIKGNVSGSVRTHTEELLMDGKLDVVIADKVWREGVDIPCISAIVFACGGTGEETTGENGLIQYIGRGMRQYKNKDDLQVSDFLDPYRYLAEHSIQRIGAYTRKEFDINIIGR